MTFVAPFARPFPNPLGEIALLPWWNVDGTTPGANVGGSCVAAYQPKAFRFYNPTTIAESYTNRANPGVNDATLGTAPTWAAGTGWTFDGSTQFLTTGLIPANDQSWSMIVQFSGITVGTSYQCICGAHSGTNRMFNLWPAGVTTNSINIYRNGQGINVAGGITSGNLCVAGNKGYKNGAAESGTIGAWADTSLQDIYIGCYNNIGTPTSYCGCVITALAIYSVALTATQVSARASAMALV